MENPEPWNGCVKRANVTAESSDILDPGEQHFRIPSPQAGLRLFLRYLAPTSPPPDKGILLYVHGATFPSALSVAHRFDGRSWRDELCAAGFHVWGLDFQGFGGSDRYPEMSEDPDNKPALGCAKHADLQIEQAVRFIIAFHDTQRISLIAHSWGTIPTGSFAGRCPELVDRIVFFAPISKRSGDPKIIPTLPAWRLVTAQAQWDRFIEDVPSNESSVLSRRHFNEWAELYLRTDQESRFRQPASVKVPCGPAQDIEAAWHGHLGYDPAAVLAPVAIVRGEWDHLVDDLDAASLFAALSSSSNKRDIKIGRSTHLMHLEQNRYALYREAETFLLGKDEPGPAR
jgi:pimeloyl-ACP methyl ester carboxylesterase